MNTWFPCWTNPNFFTLFYAPNHQLNYRVIQGLCVFFNRTHHSHHHIFFFAPPHASRISPSWNHLARICFHQAAGPFGAGAPQVIILIAGITPKCCRFMIWFARIHFYHYPFVRFPSADKGTAGFLAGLLYDQ